MHSPPAHAPLMWEYFTFILCVTFISCAVAYLIGSVPFGLILGKVAGTGDIRNIGSGNIGATNMLRTGKKGLAAATLLLDAFKGTLAVFLCRIILQRLDFLSFFHDSPLLNGKGNSHFHPGVTLNDPMTLYLCGIAAVLGHIYPLWLNFKGGKGVATTLGVFFAFQPLAGLLTIVAWLIVFILTRYSSLAAITSLALSPVIGLFICKDGLFAFMSLVLAIIVIAKHKDNIKRLRAGTESSWRKNPLTNTR